MELYKEILLNLLQQNGDVSVNLTFPKDPVTMVEMKSYEILRQIKAILEDDSLDDPECFQKIEQIVLLFDQFGGIEGRHDFG